MKMLLYLFVLTVAANAAKLPSYIEKCSKSDPKFGDCIIDRAEKLLPTLLDGSKELYIPPLEPFHLTEISMEATDSLHLKLQDVNIIGLSKGSFTKVAIDFNNFNVSAEITIPRIEILAQYEVKGKILILPIDGTGPINVTIENPVFSVDFRYEIVPNEKGIGHAVIKDPTFKYTISKAHFRLENLFNGNKELGDQMNKFINENWLDFAKDIRPAVSATILQVLLQVLNAICKMFPFDDLFLP